MDALTKPEERAARQVDELELTVASPIQPAAEEMTVRHERLAPAAEHRTASYCHVSKDGHVSQLYDDSLDAEVERVFRLGVTLQDRYRLIDNLGRGGMGRVFLARDQLLDRLVAVKVVPRRASGAASTSLESLAREARLVASLNDPGVAAVFDFGVHEGSPFTVFEYVEGRTLRQLLLRCGRMPLADVQTLAAALARSLDYAHSLGVVHRDLKPENVCMAAAGQPKILDFGVARDLRSESDLGAFCGTPQYASPEQAAYLPATGRADQYSLALVVYELLSGERPFTADDALDLLRQHREREPDDLRTHCPDLPEPAAMAVRRALQKAPERRFATCQEFVQALGPAAEAPSGRAVAPVEFPPEERIGAYVCHAAEDSLVARQLARGLSERGFDTWYYQRDALPGVSMAAQTAEAVRRSHVVLLLISRQGAGSRDVAADVREAHRAGRPFVPLLVGVAREEFQSWQPPWRAMLGAAAVIEVDRNLAEGAVDRVAAALEALGAPQAATRAHETHNDSSPRQVNGQVWSTDASQIDVQDLRQVVFRSDAVNEFLNRRNKHFLSGAKGLGKTLLLTYKRRLLSEAAGDEGVVMVPHGRPFLDFMSELRLLSARYEKPLSELKTTKRFWSMALRVAAISHYPGVIDQDEAFEIEPFPPRCQRWLRGARVEPSVVFKELTDLSVGAANSLVDETENFLDQKFRRIHGATCFFIDKVDQAARRLPRDAWINIQAGLIEAAWDLMNANGHVKAYASIRHEAFVNYESDVKANLLGATTVLRYSDEELEDLMNRLASCYESRAGFKDFVGLNVVKEERRSAPEDSFRFLRRHGFGRPRDLVAMAAELSSHRSSLTETKYCELVRRTSANHLAPSLFDEIGAFLDCLGDREARMRFLSQIPANILRRNEAIAACARFNGLDEIPPDAESGDAIFHPFQDLYLAGLLGVLARDARGDGFVQRFRRPDDLLAGVASPLPKSPWYFLHPSLSGLIELQRGEGEFLVYEHVLAGDGAPWEPRDERFCEAEKFAARLTSLELRAATRQVLKIARDLVNGQGAGDLPRTFAALPEWRELRERLLAERADELVLWIEELSS